MRTLRRLTLACMLLALVILQLGAQAFAQEGDPPTRVARINFVQGAVSFQPGGEGDWVSAAPNRPLTTGDNLWADKDARSELHIGSTVLRMSSETSLTFLNLNDQNVQLRLSLGSLIVNVRHLDDDEVFEIDTPNLALSLLRTGEYRIDVNGDGNETAVTVWRGRGEVTGGGSSYTVVGGQQARFSGTDRLGYDIGENPGNDDFDDWAFERDRREERSESANYVSQDLTGYEDLDDYGHWHYVSGYGPVWAPAAIPEGWAPYRFGHWVWIEPWGWTWVEDEPWGFAPFHYGRWAFVDSGWCWVPGPVFVRPVYAPALVVFVGGAGGWRAAGGPGVAWFPLAPGEVYVPGYRASRTYVNNVNVTNTVVNVTKVTNVYNTTINQTNVTRIHYVNEGRPNAVTAVSRETFVNARPVSRNLVQVNSKEVADAPISHTASVQPVRASVLGAGAPARAKPPAAVASRKVVARRTPAPPVAPFEQRQNAINARPAMPNGGEREMGGRPREVPRPDDSRAAPRSPMTREEEPGTVGRPAEPGSAQVPRPQARRPQESEEPSRASQTWSHPLARPAPPVQEKSPNQSREEENKFNAWEQQHERSAPRPEPRAEPRSEPKH